MDDGSRSANGGRGTPFLWRFYFWITFANEISGILELLNHVGIHKQDGPDKASTRNGLGERQPETASQGN